MAISNYTRPQLEVHELLEVTNNLTSSKMSACVVGAGYDVYRYGKEDITPVPYELDTGTQVIPLQYTKDPAYNYVLDENSVELHAENLCARLVTDDTALVDKNDIFVLRTGNAANLFAWSDTAEPGKIKAFDGTTDTYKKVSIGDRVVLFKFGDDSSFNGSIVPTLQFKETVEGAIEDADYVDAIVVDLVGKVTAAAAAEPYTTNSSKITGLSTSGTINDTVINKDTTIQVVITSVDSSKANVVVTDTEGLIIASNASVTLGTPGPIALSNSGLSLTCTIATGAKVGDAIYVSITAAYESTVYFDGIKLNVPAMSLSKYSDAETVNSPRACAVFKQYSGQLTGVVVGNTSYNAADNQPDGVIIEGVPSCIVDGVALPYIKDCGDIYTQFRLLVDVVDQEDVHKIESLEDITTYFGTIAPENDIAYGCYCMYQGAGGRAFYALRTNGQTADDYSNALNSVETNSDLYSFAILNSEEDVRTVAKEFVEERSQATSKRWCRAIFGVDVPEEYTVASKDNKDQLLKATIQNTSAGYMLQLSSDNDFSFTDINYNGASVSLTKGDYVELTTTGARYKIKSVRDTILYLESGPANGVVGMVVKFIKTASVENTKMYLTSIAQQLNSRRCTVVWCDSGANDDGIISNKYIAANVAGISSSVVPQAPITRSEVDCITSATKMYTKYKQTDLDDIAKYGVLIVTQDSKNTVCYIRHQLTTDTENGNMYFEESFTRNIDNISYAVTDVLDKYIGTSNVTKTALTSIEVAITEILTNYSQDSPSDLIGPSIIEWSDLVVEQDPIFKDRVNASFKVALPSPLNNIIVKEVAVVATVNV